MKLILSPTKTMVTCPRTLTSLPDQTSPFFENEASHLNQALRNLTLDELKKIFKTSRALTEKTAGQIQGFDRALSGPALFTFSGDAFKAMKPLTFDMEQIHFANSHLRILSGMYGVLTPLDMIKPYRLDFSTHFKVNRENLKQFWEKRLITYFQDLLEEEEQLINLASDEYSAPLKAGPLKERMINLHFRTEKNGELKNLAIRSKQARGIFCRAIILEKLTDPKNIKNLAPGGYTYAPDLSGPADWFFIS